MATARGSDSFAGHRRALRRGRHGAHQPQRQPPRGAHRPGLGAGQAGLPAHPAARRQAPLPLPARARGLHGRDRGVHAGAVQPLFPAAAGWVAAPGATIVVTSVLFEISTTLRAQARRPRRRLGRPLAAPAGDRHDPAGRPAGLARRPHPQAGRRAARRPRRDRGEVGPGRRGRARAGIFAGAPRGDPQRARLRRAHRQGRDRNRSRPSGSPPRSTTRSASSPRAATRATPSTASASTTWWACSTPGSLQGRAAGDGPAVKRLELLRTPPTSWPSPSRWPRSCARCARASNTSPSSSTSSGACRASSGGRARGDRRRDPRRARHRRHHRRPRRGPG